MKITKEMIAKGWKKDASGTWRAPVLVTQESKRERIAIEESKVGPGWVRAPIVQPEQATQVAAWTRFGLSHAEALIATGVVTPSPKNKGGDTPFGLLRKSLTRGRSNGHLTD